MIALCTLYDSHYLNRGLALYESIERYSNDYVMYVLAMDDTCYDILSTMRLPRMRPIRLSDFETADLQQVKKGRSVGEYCWTCKAPLIKYALADSHQDYCAYLDSDLYFYGDPHLFVNEMLSREASVLLVGHRYNRFAAKADERKIGKYCAGTVVFKANDAGMRILDTWERQCLECCCLSDDGIHYGDQKYLDEWPIKEPSAVETANMGAGVASWNLAQYRLISQNEHGPTIVRHKNKDYAVLFYHFHALVYTAPRRVKSYAMTAWGASKVLLDCFYKPYLNHIDAINRRLKLDFGLDVNNMRKDKKTVSSSSNRWKQRLMKVNNLLTFSGWKFLMFQDLPTKIYWNKDEVSF